MYKYLQSIQLHSNHISQYSLNKKQLMEWRGICLPTNVRLFATLNCLSVTQYHKHIHSDYNNSLHVLNSIFT
jgi:hypothetical protein